MTQKVDHFDKLLLAGKQTIGKGCMCKKHCKTQVILRFLHKRHRIICYYRDVFTSKKPCLLLRRFQWQFGRLQGDPKEGFWGCLCHQNPIKNQYIFRIIFMAFLKVLGNLYPTPPTRPPSSLRSMVLEHFWLRIDKTPCVFAFFAERRF